MATTTKLSFEEFQKLQESADENVRYELDEGALILTPSPTPWHNIVALRLSHALKTFVQKHRLGIVISEVDFRLSRAVRKPDVAFIAKERIKDLDLHHAPIEGAPSLAIEIISPSNLAQDTLKKVHQYLAAGCNAVWLVYPYLGIIEIHDIAGIREVTAPNPFNEERLFQGIAFSLSLTELFDEDPER
jgi:Uma2 family endonuclease